MNQPAVWMITTETAEPLISKFLDTCERMKEALQTAVSILNLQGTTDKRFDKNWYYLAQTFDHQHLASIARDALSHTSAPPATAVIDCGQPLCPIRIHEIQPSGGAAPWDETTWDDLISPAIRSIWNRCEAGVDSFSNDDMSIALVAMKAAIADKINAMRAASRPHKGAGQ